MNIDFNLNIQLSKAIEEGQVFKNVYGPGCTGLQNLGNSCYMNSLIQVLFSLEPFKQRFLDTAVEHLMLCNENSLECYECQMSKIMFGLHSGLYSEKKERPLLDKEGNKSEKEEYQDGIRPKSFKNFFNKNHEEFSTNKQQDVFEYMNFLLERIEREEILKGRESILEPFEFDIETKLSCTDCKGFKLNKERTNFLLFTIPNSDLKVKNKTGCLIEESMKEWLSIAQVDIECDKCKKKTVFNKRQRMVNFPQYLIVLYQRFVYDWVPYKVDIDLIINYDKIDFALLSSDFKPIEGEFKLANDLIVFKKQSESVSSKDEGVEPTFDKDSLAFLIDMGIPELPAKHALLKNSQNQALALDWYFNNSSDPSLFEPIQKIKVKIDNSTSKSGNDKTVKFNENDVAQLMEFGFIRSQAEGALLKFNNNVEQASDFLFNNANYVFESKEEKANAEVGANRVNKKTKEIINEKHSSQHSLLGKFFGFYLIYYFIIIYLFIHILK